MRTSRAMGVSVTLLLLAATPPPAARACSSAACALDYLAPTVATRVPANAPALVFGAHQDTPTPVAQLFGPGDAPIDIVTDPRTEPSFALVRPRTPLSPGRYRLAALNRSCVGGAGIRSADFEVLPPRPLPTVAGTVSVGPQQRLMRNDLGPCARSLDTVAESVSLTFVPSPELEPFMPVTRLRVTVDGERWAESLFGTAASAAGVARSVGEIFATCAANGASAGVPPGRHKAVLEAEVAGLDPPLPGVPFEFELRCDAAATAAAQEQADRQQLRSDGGCAFGGGGTGGALGGVALASIALARVRRSGRRRR